MIQLICHFRFSIFCPKNPKIQECVIDNVVSNLNPTNVTNPFVSFNQMDEKMRNMIHLIFETVKSPQNEKVLFWEKR